MREITEENIYLSEIQVKGSGNRTQVSTIMLMCVSDVFQLHLPVDGRAGQPDQLRARPFRNQVLHWLRRGRWGQHLGTLCARASPEGNRLTLHSTNPATFLGAQLTLHCNIIYGYSDKITRRIKYISFHFNSLDSQRT